MTKTALMVLAGMVAGFAIASWWPSRDAATPLGVESARPGAERLVPSLAGDRPGAELAERLARLEDALAAELAERASLEARLDELALEVRAARAAEPTQVAVEESVAAWAREAVAVRRGPGDRSGDLLERLVAAGFSTDRAQWVAERLEQLPMEALRAQYEARRDGTSAAERPLALERTLRSELGDADYERYLDALGRPTAVEVRGVLASSPAEQAGLRAGDRIVAYGGERIFDARDLNRLTLDGTPGETVLVDVLRDGQRLQVAMPRGPVGITGAGRFFRP